MLSCLRLGRPGSLFLREEDTNGNGESRGSSKWFNPDEHSAFNLIMLLRAMGPSESRVSFMAWRGDKLRFCGSHPVPQDSTEEC